MQATALAVDEAVVPLAVQSQRSRAQFLPNRRKMKALRNYAKLCTKCVSQLLTRSEILRVAPVRVSHNFDRAVVVATIAYQNYSCTTKAVKQSVLLYCQKFLSC